MRNNAATHDAFAPIGPPVRDVDRALERARRLTRWLDARLVDPVVGLVLPGVGDAVSAGVGIYLVAVGVRRRLPRLVIARMLVNLSIDALLGAVPILGDGFDFAFRANRRNLALLERNHARLGPRASELVIVGAAAGTLIMVMLLPLLALWTVYSALR